jgi:hypothetical protein
MPLIGHSLGEILTRRILACIGFSKPNDWRLRQSVLESEMFVARLRIRPHNAINGFETLNSPAEDESDLLLALMHGCVAIPSDKNTAVDNLFEHWVPCWIRMNTSDNTWISQTIGCEVLGSVRELASSKYWIK